MNKKDHPSPLKQLSFLLLAACTAVTLLSISSLQRIIQNRINYLSDIQIPESDVLGDTAQLDSVKKIIENFSPSNEMPFERDGKLNSFFEAIEGMLDSGGKVHIAYFGDSMIEGDLLTAEFRKKMQSLFGGNGVGYIPITSPVAGFRNTIRHEFNQLWQEHNFTQRDMDRNALFGPCGHFFTAQAGAEVQFHATHFPFAHTQLIWNRIGSGKVEVQWDQLPPLPYCLHADSTNGPVIRIGTKKAKHLTLRCTEGQPQLLGLNFENGDGVYVDNFAFRGSTGTSLSTLDSPLMQSISDSLNYKLLIIQYGLNVLGAGVTDYRAYQKAMERTIDHLQKCFPGASILLVGMTDKGINENGKWIADPAVPFLLNHQMQIAQNKSLAFYSLYHAMGGEGSMLAWVNDSTPRLANKDYTHPNFQGANVLADSIFAYIKRSYDAYQLQQPKVAKKVK